MQIVGYKTLVALAMIRSAAVAMQSTSWLTFGSAFRLQLIPFVAGVADTFPDTHTDAMPATAVWTHCVANAI